MDAKRYLIWIIYEPIILRAIWALGLNILWALTSFRAFGPLGLPVTPA